MPEASVAHRETRLRRRTRSGSNASIPVCGHGPFRPRSLLAIMVGMAFMPGLQVQPVALGDIVPRSSLGEPFAVRIPVQLDAGEEFAASCVTILPNPDTSRGASLPPRLRASIEIVSGQHYLALRNSTPLNEPVVGLRLE